MVNKIMFYCFDLAISPGQPCSVILRPQIDEMIRLATGAPPGHLVEVGVYQGGSAWHLAHIARAQSRELHLFDTFSGIPYRSEIDDHDVSDFSDVSLDTVKDVIPDAKFHVGIFPATLPADLTDIAFAHIDCDQYQSVRACIDELMPRLVVGGIMLFDDYLTTRGATQAVIETFGYDIARTSWGRGYVIK